MPRLSDLLRVPVGLDSEVYWCVQRVEAGRIRLVHPGTTPVWVDGLYAAEVYEIRRPIVCHRLDSDTVRQLGHPNDCPNCDDQGSLVFRLDGHIRLWCKTCAEVWEIACRDGQELAVCTDCLTSFTTEQVCKKCDEWRTPNKEEV
jgi:hypothetical protein